MNNLKCEIIDGKITNPSNWIGSRTFDISYEDFIEAPEKYYIYDETTDDIILNPNFNEEQAQKESEKIQKIFLTKLQFFKALKELHNITSSQVLALIENNQDYLDEFNFSSGFLRRNPLFNQLAPALNLTPEEVDMVFVQGQEY